MPLSYSLTLPQSVDALEAEALRVLDGAVGSWRTATIPSERAVISVCTCGELHSMVVHGLEFVRSHQDCGNYGNIVTRVSAELPVTWITSDACLPWAAPLS